MFFTRNVLGFLFQVSFLYKRQIVFFFFCFYFFFQAEDGIRDLVRSRGLGDVYKRQQVGCARVLLTNL